MRKLVSQLSPRSSPRSSSSPAGTPPSAAAPRSRWLLSRRALALPGGAHGLARIFTGGAFRPGNEWTA